MATTYDDAATATGVTRLVVEVGNENFEPGRTRLELDTDGRLRLTNRLAGEKPQQAEATVDPEQARRLIQTAVGAATGDVQEGKQYGLPDEPRYEITVYSGDERIGARTLWRSELPEHRELARVITELQELIDKHSRGEFLL